MNIKIQMDNIQHFSTAADVVREYSDSDIDSELMEYIDSLDDYESFDYFVIDGAAVIVTDGICGTVINAPQPIDEFTQTTIDYAAENME